MQINSLYKTFLILRQTVGQKIRYAVPEDLWWLVGEFFTPRGVGVE